MGRMSGHGISASALPYSRRVPKHNVLTPSDVIDLIVRFAKKGFTESQIGVILRDQYGIPQVRFLTGKKIHRILKKKGVAPKIPEDLYHLIKKAVAMRKHLEKNKKDLDAKFRLNLKESRIHRITRYYRKTGKVAANFKYVANKASALVSAL